jgi:hypothetical protein
VDVASPYFELVDLTTNNFIRLRCSKKKLGRIKALDVKPLSTICCLVPLKMVAEQ